MCATVDEVMLEAGIYYEENRAICDAFKADMFFLPVLNKLHQRSLLTQENFNSIIAKGNFLIISMALMNLEQSQLLSQTSLTLILTHHSPDKLAAAFCALKKAKILGTEIQERIVASEKPKDLAYVLICLKKADIFTSENVSQMITYGHYDILSEIFTRLQSSAILNQVNLDALLMPTHANLLSADAIAEIWLRIPTHLFGQAAFLRLLTASEQAHPHQALAAERDRILGIVPIPVAAPVLHFNLGQSTHTASVHHSVTVSAQRLMEIYGKVDLEVVLQSIKAYVLSLTHSLKHSAAKRCIIRIMEEQDSFMDPCGISIRQLLGLAYLAIQDEKKLTASVEDAKAFFIDGLYEIQRGYNLNLAGLDDGKADAPICKAGTFNKIMEKLQGIHTEVSVNYITHEGAMLKFPKIAEAAAMRYLKGMASPATSMEYLSVSALLRQLEREACLEPIWSSIQNEVESLLWAEFQEAYAHNRSHRKFQDLIENGIYLALPKALPSISSLLIVSLGRRSFFKDVMQENRYQQTLLSACARHLLWSNRHISPQTQHAFDCQWGITEYRGNDNK